MSFADAPTNLFASPPRSYISNSDEIIDFDDSILEELVEWMIEFAIYESFEYHQNIRNESLQIRSVKSYVTNQTARVCTYVKKQFKKVFMKILSNYLNCSERKQNMIVENIRNRAEVKLIQFNVKIPDFFFSVISDLIKDLVYETAKQEELIRKRNEAQNQINSNNRRAIVSSTVISNECATTINNDIARPFTPASIDLVRLLTPQSINMDVDEPRLSVYPKKNCNNIVERRRTIVSDEDIKGFFADGVYMNNNNTPKIEVLFEPIEISDDEEDLVDVFVPVQTIEQNQSADDKINDFLKQHLPELLNNLVPKLVNKRVEEICNKQLDYDDTILENTFLNGNNNVRKLTLL